MNLSDSPDWNGIFNYHTDHVGPFQLNIQCRFGQVRLIGIEYSMVILRWAHSNSIFNAGCGQMGKPWPWGSRSREYISYWPSWGTSVPTYPAVFDANYLIQQSSLHPSANSLTPLESGTGWTARYLGWMAPNPTYPTCARYRYRRVIQVEQHAMDVLNK